MPGPVSRTEGWTAASGRHHEGAGAAGFTLLPAAVPLWCQPRQRRADTSARAAESLHKRKREAVLATVTLLHKSSFCEVGSCPRAHQRPRVCLQTLFTKSCYDREMCYYDIPEDLWLRLEPILPTEGSPRGGRPIGDVRNFLNAVHWMLRTGSPWRALPEKYGSWKTVYSRFRRWQKRGYLAAILKLLTLQADMDHIMIDGTYVHAHKHSTGARHTSGINQALGRSRGGFTSKIHAVVDALGNLLAFTVTAGQYSEYPQASHLLIQYHNTTILADKGYDSRSLIDALHQQGCEAVIPSRRTNHHPRTIDRHLYKERHLIETFFNKIKEYRKIATRYDKLAEVFAAFVCLAASLIWLR